MEELKRRILSDAVVGEGDIIHVDMFLNHCMDIQIMKTLGKNMAWMLKCIEAGKKAGVQMPVREDKIFTNFIR